MKRRNSYNKYSRANEPEKTVDTGETKKVDKELISQLLGFVTMASALTGGGYNTRIPDKRTKTDEEEIIL